MRHEDRARRIQLADGDSAVEKQARARKKSKDANIKLMGKSPTFILWQVRGTIIRRVFTLPMTWACVLTCLGAGAWRCRSH